MNTPITAGRNYRHRRFTLESLEDRQMLAADWQNPAWHVDVNNDGSLSSADLLPVINNLISQGIHVLDARPEQSETPLPYLDVNGDGQVTLVDAVAVVNAIIKADLAAAQMLTAGLLNDTAPGGLTDDDGITADPTIVGKLSSPGQIQHLWLGFDSIPEDTWLDILPSVDQGGNFTITAAQLASLAGGSLQEGQHTVHLRATAPSSPIPLLDIPFSLLTSSPEAPAPTVERYTKFILMSGIGGEAVDPAFKGMVVIDNFTMPESRTIPEGAKDQQRGRGQTTMGEVVVAAHLDISTVKIQEACANGKFFQEVELFATSRQITSKLEPYYRLKLFNVIVTSCRVDLAQNTVEFTLNGTKSEWTYILIDPLTGKRQGEVHGEFNPGSNV